jgi:hypothetical protein
MSSILCLWKYPIYVQEKKEGLSYYPEFNSKQIRLHSATTIGENAYLVTYSKKHCYIVGKITIAKKKPNQPGYKFGEFKIIGNVPQSQYFNNPIEITKVLRQLHFKTGKRIGDTQLPLSLYLQTIRELTEDDVALIESHIP